MLLAFAKLTAYLLLLWPQHNVVVASEISLSRDTTTIYHRRCRRRPRREISCWLVQPMRMLAIHSFRRRPTKFNTSARVHLHTASDNRESHSNTDNDIVTSSIILPSRCSSRDAASIIRNCSATDGLLIITCDASGRGVGNLPPSFACCLMLSAH